MFSFRKALRTLCMVLITAASLDSGAAGQAIPLVRLQGKDGETISYRLQVSGDFISEGLKLAWVDAHGPGAWLETNQRDVYAQLEPGDLITAVNEVKFQNREQFGSILGQGALKNRTVSITVRDGGNNVESTYVARPIRVKALPPAKKKIPVEMRATNVRAIIVGQTADPTIGKAVEASIEQLKALLQLKNGTLPSRGLEELIELVILTGNDASPKKILSEIVRMEVKRTEALLFIYLGHGAYDPTKIPPGFNDVSGGHYFALSNTAGQDLMRAVVGNELLKKQPRLLVMISDACNVNVPAQVPRRPQDIDAYEGDNWALGNLLLDYEGSIDLNSARRDSFGWCDNGTGLWFTHALCQVADPTRYQGDFVTWPDFLATVTKESNRLFLERQRRDPNNVDLQRQTDLSPQVFFYSAERTDLLPVPRVPLGSIAPPNLRAVPSGG
jgi:hypothetical protein